MTLANLSDEELLTGLTTICAKANEYLAQLIAYLVEVERRGLHERAAYCSMYDFCKRRLALSNGATFRRLTASRLASAFPIILERLERGAVTLEALVVLRDHLTAANVVELLDAVAYKTTQQVETLVAARFPRPDLPDTIRSVASSARPEMAAGTNEQLPSEGSAPATSGADAAAAALGPSSRRVSRMKPRSADRTDIIVTVSNRLCKEIEFVQDLMRHQNLDGNLEMVLDAAIALLREKLLKQVRGQTTRPLAKARPCKAGRVPTATKRAVFERDADQCTYVDGAGNRCPAKTLLEIHHLQSKARGGTEDIENLCVRCRTHNQMDAKEVFGREYIKAKIDARRRKSAGRGS